MISFLGWVVTLLNFWELGIGAIFTLFCVVLYRLDNAQDTTFKFHDFFTSGDWHGKASVSRLGYFGAFLTHSLIMLHREMHAEGISTEMISFYALVWSGAYVALKAIEMRTAPTQPKGDRHDRPDQTEHRSDP
jgi:hypothetical protein